MLGQVAVPWVAAPIHEGRMQAARWFAFSPLTFCEFLRELSHPELSLRHQLEWCQVPT